MGHKCTDDTLPVHRLQASQPSSSHDHNGLDSSARANTSETTTTARILPTPPHATEAECLNTQSPIALVRPKDEAFERARQMYAARFTQDDKTAFKSASDVMKRLLEIHRDQTSLMERFMAATPDLDVGELSGASLVGTSK